MHMYTNSYQFLGYQFLHPGKSEFEFIYLKGKWIEKLMSISESRCASSYL